jgi:hypothetical protein
MDRRISTCLRVRECARSVRLPAGRRHATGAQGRGGLRFRSRRRLPCQRRAVQTPERSLTPASEGPLRGAPPPRRPTRPRDSNAAAPACMRTDTYAAAACGCGRATCNLPRAACSAPHARGRAGGRAGRRAPWAQRLARQTRHHAGTQPEVAIAQGTKKHNDNRPTSAPGLDRWWGPHVHP